MRWGADPPYDKGLTNSADVLLVLFTDFSQLEKIEKNIASAKGEKIFVFNDFGRSENELRKISARLQSKKYNFVVVFNFSRSPTTAGSCNSVSSSAYRVRMLSIRFSIHPVYTKPPISLGGGCGYGLVTSRAFLSASS